MTIVPNLESASKPFVVILDGDPEDLEAVLKLMCVHPFLFTVTAFAVAIIVTSLNVTFYLGHYYGQKFLCLVFRE